VVDWYYIFPILELGVYPSPKTIYNGFTFLGSSPIFCPYLLKTFSINPFQGQYPNTPVRMNAMPINPMTQRKIPSILLDASSNMFHQGKLKVYRL